MKLSEIRYREDDDDYDPGDEYTAPELELELVDPPDSEDPTEHVLVKVVATEIHTEPPEYEGGYLRHSGYAQVEDWSVEPFTFKGVEHKVFDPRLIKHLNEYEHDELTSVIHAVREGLVDDGHAMKSVEAWITKRLDAQLERQGRHLSRRRRGF